MYNYTDHLGNNRLSYTWDKSAQALAIIEENNYYPFGLTHENYNVTKVDYDRDDSGGNVIMLAPVTRLEYQYKYNGKEFQDELGLNFYDHGARKYDAALGRWMNIDPLAELVMDNTPYNYVINNPVSLIDPDGRIYADPNETDKKSKHRDEDDERVGADGLTNSQWIQASKPQADPALAGQYRNGNRAAEKRKQELSNVLKDLFNSQIGNDDNIEINKIGGPKNPKWYRDAFESYLKERFKNSFSFADAIYHYRYGGGEDVVVNMSSLDFSKLHIKDFENPDFYHQGYPAIFVKFETKHFTNRTQALIYGTIEVVYIGGGLIMALPNEYDFDIKFRPTPEGILRDVATLYSHQLHGSGTPFWINFAGVTSIKP